MLRLPLALLLIASGAAAQEALSPETPAAPDTSRIYLVVGEPPALVGGMEALVGRVVYPPEAADARQQGRVYVEMVVERDGTASDLACVRAPGPELCTAALEAVAASPFTPGRLRGTAVRTRHVVPVDFRLPDPEPAPASGGLAPLTPGQTLRPAPVETHPELIGGLAGLVQRLVYPEDARREGVEGRVFVQFVVDASGAVSEPECARSPDERLCAAAIDAVLDSTFVPGTQRGKPVSVRFTLPIDFRLR